MTEPKPPKSDLLVLAQVAVVVVSLAIVLNLMSSCQKKNTDDQVPEPHKDLVLAMRDYCRVGDLPRDQWRETQRAWGFQNGGNPNVMNMWNRAARDKHPIAIKVVRRAADLAVGPDKCSILDILDRPERVPPQSPPNQPPAAAPSNQPTPSTPPNQPTASTPPNQPAPSASPPNQPAPSAAPTNSAPAGSAAR
jgi:hypothetical protein